MAQANDDSQIASSASDFSRDWDAVRQSADIQYSPLPPAAKPSELPSWLAALGEWLRSIFEPIGKAIGISWPVIQWILIGIAVLFAGLLLWRLVVEPFLAMRRTTPLPKEPEWAPSRALAVALLEDADKLAGQGMYEEAVHLLLQRSVQHIGDARPDWLQPASTAREISCLPSLPERARTAFSEISGRVERSLFALRALDIQDWQAARSAYADFALVRIGAAESSAVHE